MNQRNKILEVYGLWLVDLLSILISFILATLIRFGNLRDMGVKDIHFMTCAFLMLAATAYNFFFDWNRDFLKRGILKEIYAEVSFNAFIVVATLLLLYAISWAQDVSRLTMGYFMLLNPLCSLFFHLLVKRIFRFYYKSSLTSERVLVVTQKELLADTVARLRHQLDISVVIAGICVIDENLKGSVQDGVPVIAGREDLLSRAISLPIDAVFFHTPDYSQKACRDLIEGFEEMGLPCSYSLEMTGLTNTSSHTGKFGDYSVIVYSRFRSSYKRLMIKRLLDLIGGILGLLLTALLFLPIALAIKLDSKGPILFSQTRVGRNGRRFRIYKFRTMYLDAEERKKELEASNQMSGLMFKMEHDPRITKVGAFLRKTSLDELPQFFNIVKGEMSLVGTRPPTEDEFIQYNQYYRRRISMTPGLTGLWQVSGRSDIRNFDEVVQLDLKYIDEWSLSLDLKILIRTIGVVFSRRGAE